MRDNIFEGKKLLLKWWKSDVGCFRDGVSANEVWVRMLGFSLHLWGIEFFKRFGDACVGLMAMDEETEERRHLQ